MLLLCVICYLAKKVHYADVPKEYVLDSKPPPLTLGKLNKITQHIESTTCLIGTGLVDTFWTFI